LTRETIFSCFVVTVFALRDGRCTRVAERLLQGKTAYWCVPFPSPTVYPPHFDKAPLAGELRLQNWTVHGDKGFKQTVGFNRTAPRPAMLPTESYWPRKLTKAARSILVDMVWPPLVFHSSAPAFRGLVWAAWVVQRYS